MAFENSRIRVLEDEVVQPDGSVGPYTVIEERLKAVAVIAVDDNNRIPLVRQHRYPIDATTLELPAGEVALDGDPIEHARRELHLSNPQRHAHSLFSPHPPTADTRKPITSAAS